MSRGCTVVTGVARHSLGEALVRALLSRAAGHQIIGIDRIPNPELDDVPSFRQVIFDLNPLSGPQGLAAFATALEDALAGAVTATGNHGVEYLVQCAGLYDFGTFLDHDVQRRTELLGLNVLGTTEVLHAVMSLNHRVQRRNEKELTHILVGSFQGLFARARRPIYAPSKAYGIDLCASLVEGGEVAKCIYLAAGPIDTPMLHWNHWVRKAGGPEEFFKKALGGPRERYASVFISCDDAALEAAAGEAPPGGLEALRKAMQRYRTKRGAAKAGTLGVLSPESCAGVLVRMLASVEAGSGVYMLGSGAEGTEVVVKMAAFGSLDRRRAFDSAAQRVVLG